MRNYNKQLTTLAVVAVATVAFTMLGAEPAMAQRSFSEIFNSTLTTQIGAGGKLVKQASIVLGIVMILGALARAYKFLRDGDAAKKGVGELGYLLLAAAIGGVMLYAGSVAETGAKTAGLTQTTIGNTSGGAVGW